MSTFPAVEQMLNQYLKQMKSSNIQGMEFTIDKILS